MVCVACEALSGLWSGAYVGCEGADLWLVGRRVSVSVVFEVADLKRLFWLASVLTVRVIR